MVVRPFDERILDVIGSTTRLGDEIAEQGENLLPPLRGALTVVERFPGGRVANLVKAEYGDLDDAYGAAWQAMAGNCRMRTSESGPAAPESTTTFPIWAARTITSGSTPPRRR